MSTPPFPRRKALTVPATEYVEPIRLPQPQRPPSPAQQVRDQRSGEWHREITKPAKALSPAYLQMTLESGVKVDFGERPTDAEWDALARELNRLRAGYDRQLDDPNQVSAAEWQYLSICLKDMRKTK